MDNQKIKSFTDLNTWKEGHKLVLKIYDITSKFPREEQFGLTSQLRRAAVSVTSNISEGFSRKSNKEKKQFYYISLGSVTEIQNQIYIAKDIKFIILKDFNEIAKQSVIVAKMLNGLIRSIKN